MFAALFVLFTPVQAQTWNTTFAAKTVDDYTVSYEGVTTIIGTGQAVTPAFDLVGTDRIIETYLVTEMINDTGAVTVKLQYQKFANKWTDLSTVLTLASILDSAQTAAIDTSQFNSNDLSYRYLLTGGAANDTVRVKLNMEAKKVGFR